MRICRLSVKGNEVMDLDGMLLVDETKPLGEIIKEVKEYANCVAIDGVDGANLYTNMFLKFIGKIKF